MGTNPTSFSDAIPFPAVPARRLTPSMARYALLDFFRQHILISGLSPQIPHWFYFSGAQYAIVMDITYPDAGTDGSPVLITGGVEIPVDLQVPS
jgi:hypothetical protein